jgi:hypothetical protein
MGVNFGSQFGNASAAVLTAPTNELDQSLSIDGARISVSVFDATFFGFKAGPLSSPTAESALIAAATDTSAAARNLEDFFANWQSKTRRPVKVRFGRGYYKFDGLLYTQNTEIFYQRSGLIVEGAGSFATFFAATTSLKAQFIGLGGKSNWSGAPILRGVTLIGAGAANPYQVGVFLNPDFVNSLGFGGMTGANWEDVRIRGFAREQLWLKGGSESYLVPVQFGLWENIVAQSRTAEFPAVRFTGQVGTPYNFRGLQCSGVADSTAVVLAVGLDTRSGIPLSIADSLSNTLTFSEPHRFKTTDRFRLPSGSGTAWGGLALDTDYWAYYSDDFTIKVCSSLSNASAITPVFVTLTSASGTASVTSAQASSVSVVPGNLILESPSLEAGLIGMDVTGTSTVWISNLHGEETNSQIRVSASSVVNVHNASLGNAGKNGGTVYDGSSGGVIALTGVHDVAGVVGKLTDAPPGAVNVTGPDRWTNTYYPTVGSGIAGKMPSYHQMGNSAELDLVQRIDGEYLLNTGTTVVQNIRAQTRPGQRVTFDVFPTAGNWVEFGINGNLDLRGKAVLGSPATLRVPMGSFVAFICTALKQGWMLDSLQLPTHSLAWTLSGNVAANSSVSTTITAPGARVGDIAPSASLSVALAAGLMLSAEVTATDTVTVRIANPTAVALAGPTNPTIYCRQTR